MTEPLAFAPPPPAGASDPDELVRLKAHAYDCLAKIEYWQARLREANRRVAEWSAQAAKPAGSPKV